MKVKKLVFFLNLINFKAGKIKHIAIAIYFLLFFPFIFKKLLFFSCFFNSDRFLASLFS